jgi:acetyltransferase-like isoleucine patch superfamily enzyme
MSSNARPADAELGAPQAPSHPLDTGIVGRALREPGHAWTVAMATVRGRLFTWWAKAFRPRVIIGRGLRIYGTLHIRGPGTVVLGDGVQIYGRVTPWTNRATACIRVGDRTKLDGTRFSCVQSVEIGADCLLANCRILDTSFHATSRHDSGDSARVLEAPVTVGRNVWIAPDAGLLPGTRIGDDSVVAMAAICKGEYPAGVMILGNPARVAGRLT